MNSNRIQKLSKPLTAAAMASIFAVAASVAQAEDPMDHPINCSTAEGDLRVLESEKKHAQNQQALSVSAVTPAGAVVGMLSGKEDEKLQMLSGDYVKKINERIAATKAKCNL